MAVQHTLLADAKIFRHTFAFRWGAQVRAGKQRLLVGMHKLLNCVL